MMNEVMPAGGFSQVMPRFNLWNYMTNIRSRPGFYTESSDLPSVKFADAVLASGGTFSGSDTVDRLGASYVRVVTSGLSGGLSADFTLGSGAQWTIVAGLIAKRTASCRDV